jgi:hypothetical protein
MAEFDPLQTIKVLGFASRCQSLFKLPFVPVGNAIEFRLGQGHRHRFIYRWARGTRPQNEACAPGTVGAADEPATWLKYCRGLHTVRREAIGVAVYIRH